MASFISVPGRDSFSSVPPTNSEPRASAGSPPASGEKPRKQQQPRQLLSCSKCRERKVRCDRTKPCSACCARGHPKECQFTLGEGTTFGPIQQSLELRKLRAENQRLKERLLQAKVGMADDSDDGGQASASTSSGARGLQRRFGPEETTDSLYFGSPGLASVVEDFANAQIEPRSLSHTMPRGTDMYRRGGPTIYPFPTIWNTNTWLHGLYTCLQPWDEVLTHLEAYSTKADTFTWPHFAQEVNKKEVERFIASFEHNATTYPDMLALIFATLATGVQRGIYKAGGGQWVPRAVESHSLKGNLYVAASMQALRQSSFMSQPTLLGIQALVLLGPYLTNSGRSLDAWTLFGITIRAAQSIGLHRNPKHLNPLPTLRESALRKKLWWWLLHTDQQYSMVFGRPLGISGLGDCPFPEPLSTDPAIIRTSECVDQLTILGRQIISSPQLGNLRIDQLSDKLFGLLDTLPEEMHFSETWLSDPSKVPDAPLDEYAAVLYCKVHNYLILLNKQRFENVKSGPGWTSPHSSSVSHPPGHRLYTPLNSLASPDSDTLRGRPQVILSSALILTAFEFFHKRLPATLIYWTLVQQAFNASMILLLDMLETRDLSHCPKVETALNIFRELSEKGVHKLAELAVERISAEYNALMDLINQTWGLQNLNEKSHVDPYIRRDSQMSSSVASQGSSVYGSSSGKVTAYENMDTVMGNTGMFLLEASHGNPPASFIERRRESMQNASMSEARNPPQGQTRPGQRSRRHAKTVQQHMDPQQQASSYDEGAQPQTYGRYNPAATAYHNTTPRQAEASPPMQGQGSPEARYAPFRTYPPGPRF